MEERVGGGGRTEGSRYGVGAREAEWSECERSGAYQRYIYMKRSEERSGAAEGWVEDSCRVERGRSEARSEAESELARITIPP